jgi:hypothetical protein
MRKTLLINLLIASLVFPACSDGSATIVTDRIGGPDAPINDPDTGTFNPTNNNPGLGTGGPTPPNSGAPQANPINNPTGGGSTTIIVGPNPGEVGQGNTSGGEPVPEPGTLLLVGSGLAGIGASILHRRRRTKHEPETA